jgi:glycosyltransferase involved in cell wall biosynthesis
MSHHAESLIRKHDDFDLVLQSGLLFCPENRNAKPYVLGILDHTYLIGKLGRNRPVTTLQLSDYCKKKEAEAYHKANLILVMSNHVRNSLVEDYGVSSGNIFITGVGPNVEPDDNYVPSDNKYESKKIVMIAKDFIRKGGMEVLAAFKTLKKSIPMTELVVIGGKINYQSDGVSFIGVQDKLRIKKELSEANLYVMPSHAEPFGVAFIEAMAFHTPCIGSKVEAIPEIISDGETGFLVDPTDVEALAKRMGDILKDSSLAKSMGAAGYNKYMDQFSWSKVGSAISDRLSRLVTNLSR